MDNTELKIFTFHYINEHDLSKDQKIALMKWVKEAHVLDVKYLLATGEIKEGVTPEELSEAMGGNESFKFEGKAKVALEKLKSGA